MGSSSRGNSILPEFYFRSNIQETGSVSGAALVRYAADGTIIWQRLIRQENDTAPAGSGNYFRAVSRVYKVLADGQGNIFVSGAKGNQNNQSYAPFVAKFDASGALIWQHGFSGAIDARTEFQSGAHP